MAWWRCCTHHGKAVCILIFCFNLASSVCTNSVIDRINFCIHRILGDFPNTYAFTKNLAEALVVEQMSEMPAVIMRPSIVIPIRYEPIPGWTDNINGPTGLLIGAGKGVIRSMYCNPNTYGDYVPVDYAVNGIMVSSWNFVYNKWVSLNFNIICKTILHRPINNTYMHIARTHTHTNVVCLLLIYCNYIQTFLLLLQRL